MLQQYIQRISIHPSDSTYVLLVYCYIMFNSTKFSATFLAIVLLTGTIATISPSFIVGAQAQQEYNGIDNRYNSYEPTEYPPEYTDNNSYEREYTSYTPDYKPQYPSYEKDDRDKSKDSSSKSISINKLKCINNNVNINGNNNGTINVGNSGSSATGPGTAGGSGYGTVGYSGEGYGKQGKGFECIINNNNTNTNIVTGGGGNITDGNGNEPETTCEECFAQVLNSSELARLQVVLGNGINVIITIGTPQIEINSLGELCDVLENLTGAQVVSVVTQILAAVGIILTPAEFNELVTCIGTALGITIPRTLAASNTNTATSAFDINTAGGQASSFSSPPTIAQGTEDDLSALEKITKLKQQWLELLP